MTKRNPPTLRWVQDWEYKAKVAHIRLCNLLEKLGLKQQYSNHVHGWGEKDLNSFAMDQLSHLYLKRHLEGYYE